MTVKITEIRASQEGTDALDTSSTAALRFFLQGSDDPETMRAALVAAGLPPDTITSNGRVLTFKQISRQQLGWKSWIWTADYQDPDNLDKIRLDPGEWRLSFDTTGFKYKRYISLATTSYPNGAPDYKSAIDVQDHVANGAEIVAPTLKFTLTFRHPANTITNAASRLALAKQIANCTGRVNSATYLTFSAGELLFVGASGSVGSNDAPQIDYHFEASNNLTNQTIGGITGVNKKGHEIIWAKFKDTTSGGARIKIPEFLYVEQVYPTIDFNTALGLGSL